MGQVLHGSATTTEAVRRAIQHSQESVRALAERYNVNPKTVSKWKHRETVASVSSKQIFWNCCGCPMATKPVGASLHSCCWQSPQSAVGN
jgi:hypothetical protein